METVFNTAAAFPPVPYIYTCVTFPFPVLPQLKVCTFATVIDKHLASKQIGFSQDGCESKEKEVMESYLNENFGVNHSSDEALRRWRKICGVVKNAKLRFRFTANLCKRSAAATMRQANQEKLRTAVLVSKDAFQFIQGVQPGDDSVPEEVKAAGFQICADELGSIVEGHDVKKQKFHGGVAGIAEKLCKSTTDGLITTNSDLLNRRQEIFGFNKLAKTEAPRFWIFVWEALHDMVLMILGVCALLSLIVGITMEGWAKVAHDDLGIVASILLVVFVTATIDYCQSLQFSDLDKEKKEITIQVTRNGFRQKMSIYDLLPGTKLQDGSYKMLVTNVGIRTQWGKLMATLGKGAGDETPLQVKLNGVATIIGTIGLFFAMVAKESVDVIILDDNFSAILTMAKWGRSVYINIKKFVQFQLTVKVVALIVTFSSACLTGNAPPTVVQLLRINMIIDTLGALAPATEPIPDELMKSAPLGKKANFISKVMSRNILGQSLYEFAVIWYLYGPDADLILNTLIFSSFVFCQVAKQIADSIILDDNFSTFVTVVQWGWSVYINVLKFVQLQLTVNVLPLIVNFSSSCLSGNAALTAVLLLTLGALARKTMAKHLFSIFILLGLVFLLEVQAVDGSHLKVVSDVKVSLPPPSCPPTYSNQKEADTAPPPPSANHLIHN